MEKIWQLNKYFYWAICILWTFPVDCILSKRSWEQRRLWRIMEKLTFLLLNIFMLSAFGKGKQCPNLNNNCYFDELIALIRKRFFFVSLHHSTSLEGSQLHMRWCRLFSRINWSLNLKMQKMKHKYKLRLPKAFHRQIFLSKGKPALTGIHTDKKITWKNCSYFQIINSLFFRSQMTQLHFTDLLCMQENYLRARNKPCGTFYLEEHFLLWACFCGIFV